LPLAQQRGVGLDLGERAADIRRLLRRHATVFVEIDRGFTHEVHSRQSAARRPDRPS
jgi:hypothetical protein